MSYFATTKIWNGTNIVDVTSSSELSVYATLSSTSITATLSSTAITATLSSTAITATLSSTAVTATLSGTAASDVNAYQAGTWTIGLSSTAVTATLSSTATQDINAYQSGSWNVGLNSGTNTIGTITAQQGGTWTTTTTLSSTAITATLSSTAVTARLHDGTGYIDSVTNSYRHLRTAFIQDALTSSGNSSTAILAGSSSFTGVAEAAYGINAIQTILKTDQPCTVYIDQGPDGSDWDIVDSWPTYASVGDARTTASVAPYFRVRVQNTSTVTTTYFRLATGMTPNLEVMPRTLSHKGYLDTEVNGIHDHYDFVAENTPTGDMRVVQPYRLVGATFTGSTLDSNFWTSSLGTGGSASLANAQIILSTGTTASNTTSVTSFRIARYTGGSANRFRMVMRLPDTGTTNNTRRWGAYDGTDGAYFQLSGATFGIVTSKGSSTTLVSTGSFNGELSAYYSPGTSVNTYEIYWTNSKVWFVIGSEVLHTISANATTWANTMNLPVRFENNNAGGSTSNVSMNVRVATIYRLGKDITQPISKFYSGTTSGVVCKYGPGNIHGVIIGAPSNNSNLNIYDSLSASGSTIFASGNMSANNVPISIDFKGVPFYTGLTFAITTSSCTTTIIYE